MKALGIRRPRAQTPETVETTDSDSSPDDGAGSSEAG
jgi:hypothetical protein